MARIEKRKNGSYRIQVSCGYSANGKQHKTQSITWKPPRENMTEKQIEKALNKAAFEFEESCRSGQTVNAEKFEVFCEKWFENYASRKLKQSGIDRCKQYAVRVYEYLGHYRIDKITPLEIDKFIIWLGKEKLKAEPEATFKGNLKQSIKDKGIKTQQEFARLSGVSPQTIKAACDGHKVKMSTAEKIAAALNAPCSQLFERHKTEKGLAPKTIKNYVSFVSSVFEYAVKIKAIKENPCNHAIVPKIPQKEHKMFSIEEAKRFLDILDHSSTPIKYKAFFQLALFGGFRRGEILGLEWTDINFETRVVRVRRTVHYSKQLGYYDTDPKTKSSCRALTLPENVIYTLKQLQNEQLSDRLKLGDQWHATNRLFVTWNGLQMNGATPFAWLKKICKENDLPKVNLHSFRHLNASLLISQGIDVKTVQSVLGHSQASTTLDIYAAAFQEREALALGAVAEALTSNTKIKQA